MKVLNTFRDGLNPLHQLWSRVLVGVVGLCLTNVALALDSNRTMAQYIHEQWGAEKGFLGGTIYAICQSDDGYLWIGTERGLVRFDGSQFTLIQRPLGNGGPIGPVRGLVSDAEGNLWIRLNGPHLLRYRDGDFDEPAARLNLEDVAFTALSRDSKGDVLLWGLGSHALRHRDGKFQRVVATPDTGAVVIAITETPDRKVWLGTRDAGLFNIEQGRLVDVFGQRETRSINTLLPTTSGGLLIGTDTGMEYWDGTTLTTAQLPSAIRQLQVLSLAEDRQGNFWVGTDHGLLRMTSKLSVSGDLSNHTQEPEVTAVYEDRDGDIWYGGLRGLERLRDGIFTTYAAAQGLHSQTNGPVFVDASGRTWFAPLEGGLYWLQDGRVGQITAAGLDKDVVYSISGSDGQLWVGRQRGGLTVLTQKRNSFSSRSYTQADGLAQNSVYSVHQNRDGTVWAGTVNAGVSRLKDGRFTSYSTASGMPSNAISSIVEGYDGTMWFGTPNGLASLAVNGGWTNHTASDGLPSSEVRTIFEDSKHVLWIATSAGLASFHGGHLESTRNLPDSLREQIFGIAEDRSGSLWIVTSDHVLEVNRGRLLRGVLDDSSIQSYGIMDGLPGVEGVRRDRSVVADSLGRVWFSLNRGLVVADPKFAAGYSAPVRARIETSPPGARSNLKAELTYPAGVRSITLTYGSTSLSAPERTRFRYRLAGSDQGWSDVVSAGHVIYSDLRPGNYSFQIVASSNNGLWNGPATIVPFVVEPALWQTNWFRALCAMALVLAFAMIYRFRMYQLTRQLNVRFQERLAERTHIAQELHDTLLQGFVSASMQLDVAEDQLPADSPVKPVLGRILQLMREVNEEGRNALRGLRTSGTDSQSLDLAFSRMRQEFCVDDTIGYRVVVHSEARPLRPLIRDEVYRIGREAVLNAVLHAHPQMIEIELEYASTYLRMLVRDDGCGIDGQVLQTGREGHWGLAGMRKRSESIGAALRLRSRPGAGTEVELTVPAGVAFGSQSSGAISQLIPWLRREKFESAANAARRQGHQ